MRTSGRKKYVRETKPGYLYVYKGGKYLGRLHAPEGSEEFDREYWGILTGSTLEAKTSWRALIEDYRASPRWTKLRPATRSSYEQVLTYMLDKNGGKDVTRLRRKDVIAAQRANLHRARFANMIPAVLSVLCEHAIDIGWIEANPAKGVKKIEIPEERRKPHPVPDDAVCAEFRAKAELLPLDMFEIGVGSVQRLADWPAFDWGHYDGENLALAAQSKTGKELPLLPCTPELKSALDRLKACLGYTPHPSMPILVGQRGNRMSPSYVRQLLSAERERLGMKGAFDQHGLRYRGVMELAWSGCDDDEIMSYSGHSNKAMVIKHAGLARQIMRAKSASEKRRLWAALCGTLGSTMRNRHRTGN